MKSLGTHSGVHDSRAVSSDRVSNVSDVDGVEMLVVARVLYEDLVIQVVLVLGHEYVDVTHDFQHIQTLSTSYNPFSFCLSWVKLIT